MKNEIVIESPTRIDFSGGTLDLWPIYSIIDNCKTINLSIDIFTKVNLLVKDSPGVEIIINNLDYSKIFKSTKELLSCNDEELSLVNKFIEFFKPQFGFRLETSSQSPVGGGLGGSSSLCISIMKAFSQALNLKYNHYELVEIAKNIEANVLKKPTGCQDYFPAANPGLSVLSFGYEGVSQELIDYPQEYFAQRLFLVDTGVSHNSGINNWAVYKAFINGEENVVNQLKRLRDISNETYSILLKSEWSSLPQLFKEEFDARVSLEKSFSSKEIENLNNICMESGAEAVKICGAGGGGCVLVWAEPKNINGVMESCEKNKFKTLKINPIKK